MEEGRELQNTGCETRVSDADAFNKSEQDKTTENEEAPKQGLQLTVEQFEQRLRLTVEQFRLEMDLRDAKFKQEFLDIMETRFKERKIGQDLSIPIIPRANVIGGGVPHWTIVNFMMKHRGKPLTQAMVLVPQINTYNYRPKWE
jgi:hypothetical protein